METENFKCTKNIIIGNLTLSLTIFICIIFLFMKNIVKNDENDADMKMLKNLFIYHYNREIKINESFYKLLENCTNIPL